MRRLRVLLATLGPLALPSVAAAHDGPPFPVLVDEDVPGARLSVWADPDVGVGTFYFYVDPTEDASANLLDATSIQIAVRPVDGHAAEAEFTAETAPAEQPYQQIGEVDFDARGLWSARFTAATPGGTQEFELEIDVTPPGAGKIDLLWFLSPFLAVAFLWVKVVLKKRELARCST